MKKPIKKPSTKAVVKPSIRNIAPTSGKKAMGLYGNAYAYPNYGKFRPRFYTLGDTSQGLDTLSRELLVRWSREMSSQLPFITAAVTALASFSIGDTYLPIYTGKNTEWWKEAESWLLNDFYPNCSTKGNQYDFVTLLNIESRLLDIDGDYLVIYGTEDGFPKFQVVQNNRVRSQTDDNHVVSIGQMAGTILSDGVYYTPQGKPVGYHVQNAGNLVNLMTSNTPDLVVDTKNAQLIYDAKFIDKSRGVPSIGEAILQALSIQELDTYLMEKIKIESTIALIEKSPSGEAPLELQNTLEALNQQGTEYGGFNPSPNTHALDIVQGSQIRYVHAEGGDIKTLSSNSPSNETADFMARLETQILSTIGVPHQLIYSTDKTSGRITSGVAEMFRAAIKRRQRIMDKRAGFCIAWALAKAMDAGFISQNDEDNLIKVIEFTHPKQFSLDAKYDNAICLDNLNAGVSSMNDATTFLYNKTSTQLLDEQKNEQIAFYTRAKEVAATTGIDINTVIQGWRNQNQPTPQTLTTEENI